jgi:hypothetical protein
MVSVHLVVLAVRVQAAVSSAIAAAVARWLDVLGSGTGSGPCVVA